MTGIDVHHYKGDIPCPGCGGGYDPVSGLCDVCDPDLYRVTAMSPEWFEDETLVSPEAVVSGRNVGPQVQRFLPGSVYVVVQRLPV